MSATISIQVTGKVQGVFFRQSTKEEAVRLGITGCVKNNQDGSVRIIATGTPSQLAALEAWSKKGPSRARVDSVIISSLPFQPFITFTIER
jgi:acylphosphatase